MGADINPSDGPLGENGSASRNAFEFGIYENLTRSEEGGGAVPGKNPRSNPVRNIEESLPADARKGLVLFASLLIGIIIALVGILISQNFESVIIKMIIILPGIILGILFFAGMVWASKNAHLK